MQSFYKSLDNSFHTVCPTCKKHFTEIENKQFIDEIGECMTCDHVRSDIYENEIDMAGEAETD